jgi:hypothetical protein
MSRTKKDLKSHKKGFGKYKFDKPQRKMTPLALDADKIQGERHVLAFINNDLNMDDFDKGDTMYHGAKQVRSIRRQQYAERKYETSAARSRMKQQLTSELKTEL